MKKQVLFICGSLNQTTMMHKIASCLKDCDCYFTPFYIDHLPKFITKSFLMRHTIAGGTHRRATIEYLTNENLTVDEGGRQHDYDLVVTCTDLIIQSNIRGKRLILVQEGITEPEDWIYWVVRTLRLPRVLANTAATGLSDAYDKFCVASYGYKQHFVKKGVKPEKIVVTGIPNFDNLKTAKKNKFPHRGYVLVATSSIRETGKFDDRMGFLNRVKQIVGDREVIFKLHPNEEMERAQNEIKQVLPDALIFTKGNTNHMIANCDVLITQVSTVVYVGIALGKEVYSYFDLKTLKSLQPIQNNGKSAARIANVCQTLIQTPLQKIRKPRYKSRATKKWLPFFES